MGDNVELSVRSQLQRIIKELEEIQVAAGKVGEGLKQAGEDVGESFNSQVKRTETFLGRLRGLSGRIADQMRGDFKSLLSINAIRDSLKISDQFRGSVKEVFALSDAIRKLGRVFGIADKDYSKLQTKMLQGLGGAGLGSEVGTRTLEGLAASGTRVAGQDSLVGYSRTSGQLASVTRQQGREGDIAKQIAQVIQARGGNVNDMKQVASVAEDVRRVFNATGAGASDTLESMKQIFTSMSKDFRQKITTRGLANLAAAGTVAGPNSVKFLEEFLGKSPIARQAMEAQGFQGVFTDQGIDVDKFQRASQDILARVGGDPRLAAKTLGLSDDAAEGFVRLAESLREVRRTQDMVRAATGDLNSQYKASMGFGEAFKANINRVKGALAGAAEAVGLPSVSQALTGGLSSAAGADSPLASAGVVAGGGLLAAVLAGGGLKGIGGGLLGGMAGSLARSKAAEAFTGKETIPVYVTNAAEIGGGGAAGAIAGAAGGAGGMLGKLAGVGKFGLYGAAAGVGGLAGNALAEKADSLAEGTGMQKGLTEAVLGLSQAIGLIPKTVEARPGREQKVKVELNKRDLKESRQPTRGASF